MRWLRIRPGSVFTTLSNPFWAFASQSTEAAGKKDERKCPVMWVCIWPGDNEDDGTIQRKAGKTPSDEASRNKLIAGFWQDGEKLQNRYENCSRAECQEVEVAAIELDGRMRGAGLTLNKRWASGIP